MHAVASQSSSRLTGKYYRARYYNPAIGRFASEDPMRSISGMNFYNYVSNSPELLVDPQGLYEINKNLVYKELAGPKAIAKICRRPTAFSLFGCVFGTLSISYTCSDCSYGNFYKLSLIADLISTVYYDPRNPLYDLSWLERKLMGYHGSAEETLAHEWGHIWRSWQAAESTRALGEAYEAKIYATFEECVTAGERFRKYALNVFHFFRATEKD